MSQGWDFFFFSILRFTYLKLRVGWGRRRNILYLMIHSQINHRGWDWPGSIKELGTSNRSPKFVLETQAFRLSSTVFSPAVAVGWLRSEQPENKPALS